MHTDMHWQKNKVLRVTENSTPNATKKVEYKVYELSSAFPKIILTLNLTQSHEDRTPLKRTAPVTRASFLL